MRNTLKLSILSFGLLSMVACKNEAKPKEPIVEEVAEIGLPNASDIHFDKAITALMSNDHTTAATHLKEGVVALKIEGEKLEGKSKESFNKSVKQLEGIEKALKDNKKISINDLQEAIANAELAVGHEYLITDDFYVLTEPEKTSDHLAQKEFRRNLKVLESTLKDEKGNKALDKDGSGQKLYDEGKKLEKQLTEVMDKIKDHNKRAREHIKEYHPEHHYPTYYPYY